MKAHRNLPYGKQRCSRSRIAIACARACSSRQPAAGVPEDYVTISLATVAALPADVTVLLIEHDMTSCSVRRSQSSVAWSTAPVRRRSTGGVRARIRASGEAFYLGELALILTALRRAAERGLRRCGSGAQRSLARSAGGLTISGVAPAATAWARPR